jgi:hypothetical protein
VNNFKWKEKLLFLVIKNCCKNVDTNVLTIPNVYDDNKPVLRSLSRKEPHLLVEVGAGAVKRYGSGSDGSGSDGSGSDGSGSDSSGSDNGIKHGWELKIDTKCNSL